MLSLDTETTGLDIRHGCEPFLVTTCDGKSSLEPSWWGPWEVDPLTRDVTVDYEDLNEIQKLIDEADCLVLQNPKFDVLALQSVFQGRLRWDWGKVYDTLLAGHLLSSNTPHDLASMVLMYLNVDIQPFDDRLKEDCKAAQPIARSKYPDWRIAKPGLSEIPSAKGGVKKWKYDSWLPKLVAEQEDYPKEHSFWTSCIDYALTDAEATLALFQEQRRQLKEKGLWKIYLERLKIPYVVYQMEQRGMTLSRKRLEERQSKYKGESKKAGKVCTAIAEGYEYDLHLPKSGNNNSLLGFVDLLRHSYGKLKAPIARTKTGQISLAKDSVENLIGVLPEKSNFRDFLVNLLAKRKRDTAVAYLEGYKRFWLPTKQPEWFVLHPSLNPTGTATLRWSSQHPNEQNISKQEGFNLRYCFGPAPGREWWSLDAKNIELRIPAYEAKEKEMVDLFSQEDRPPYYGSYHLLVFDTLHPKKFAKHGRECKQVYASTWYQWTKNGNFAVQYGAVESSGTADKAYHVPGAQRRIQGRFRKIAGLNRYQIMFAEAKGYVETIPDKTVDPKHGYPLYCTRTNSGRILPTVPLNYFVSGTAMWWMGRAMVRVQKYLDELNRKDSQGYYMIIQVHDELVFDFPKGRHPKANLSKIRKIQKLMEMGGGDIGIPTPVAIEYHPETWAEGKTI